MAFDIEDTALLEDEVSQLRAENELLRMERDTLAIELNAVRRIKNEMLAALRPTSYADTTASTSQSEVADIVVSQ